MALDLSTTPAERHHRPGIGDAHLSNFGLFASPERTLVFDSNDFDETLPGPWEWDVKRLAASVVIAARSNGFTPAEARASTLATVAAYRDPDGALLGDAAARHLVRPDDRDDIENHLIEAGQAAGRMLRQGRQGPPPDDVRQGPRQGPDEGERLADVHRRRPMAHQGRPADRGPRRAARRAGRAGTDVQRLPRDARREPARARRALSIRRLRAQGRRRRQRRHSLLRGPAGGSRRGRSPVPPGQGGDRIGPRPVSRVQQAHEPRRARRRRPAAHAGDARHLPGLDAWPGRARLLLPPAVGHEGLGRRGHPAAAGSRRSTAACAPVAGARARPER